jgi:hypothetical protein
MPSKIFCLTGAHAQLIEKASNCLLFSSFCDVVEYQELAFVYAVASENTDI